MSNRLSCHLPPPVSRSVAGGVKLKTALLQRKLGLNAWRLWVAMIWRRNNEGISWATRETLANAANLNAYQVKRAVRRLSDLHLIDTKALRAGTYKWATRVYGDFRQGQVTTPAVPALMIQAAGQRGGDTTSGKAKIDKKERQKMAAEAQKILEITGKKRRIKTRKTDQTAPEGLPTKPHLTTDQTAPCIIGLKKDSFSLQRKAPAGGAPQKINSEDTGGGLAPSHPEQKNPEEPSSDQKQASTLASRLSSLGKRSDSKPKSLDKRFILPSCGTKAIPPRHNKKIFRHTPKTKAPPKLDPEAALRLNVFLLVLSYRGAHQAKLQAPSFMLSNADLRATKYWKPLVEATEALIAEDISPGEWALWSFDQWASNSKKEARNSKAKGGPRKKKVDAPPLRYVFDAEKIRKNAGWFRQSEKKMSRIWVTEAQKHYLRLWDEVALRLRLMPAKEARRFEVQKMVFKEVFPNGVEEHIENAIEDFWKVQTDIDQALQNADWGVL